MDVELRKIGEAVADDDIIAHAADLFPDGGKGRIRVHALGLTDPDQPHDDLPVHDSVGIPGKDAAQSGKHIVCREDLDELRGIPDGLWAAAHRGRQHLPAADTHTFRGRQRDAPFSTISSLQMMQRDLPRLPAAQCHCYIARLLRIVVKSEASGIDEPYPEEPPDHRSLGMPEYHDTGSVPQRFAQEPAQRRSLLPKGHAMAVT